MLALWQLRKLRINGRIHGPGQVRQAASLSSPDENATDVFPYSEVLMTTTFGPRSFLDRWAEAVRAFGVPVKTYPHEVQGPKDLERIEFAVCFDPQPGLFHQCPNLRAVQSMGAGVSPGMLEDRVVPSHIPLLRIVDPLTAQRMATFVMWAVINWQRKCDAYMEAQQQRRWDKKIENYTNVDNADVSVGILGLGNIGTATADLLMSAGYRVAAWSRTVRHKAGVECFAGQDQLRALATRSNVLVNLLPLTQETRGVLNAELFSWLPRGAYVINVSRGAHLVEADMLAALDSGQLSGATLDVHNQEPLPADSPLWAHPGIRVFPHITATPHIPFVAGQVVENMRCILEGRPVPQERVVCRQRGY